MGELPMETAVSSPLDSGGVCYDSIGLHFTMQIHQTALFHFPFAPHTEAHVQYNLMSSVLYNTIWWSFLYDTILWSSLVRYQSQSHAVMATLSKMSDFVYFLPFLFSLYHYSESSRTFYDDPPTSVVTHTLDHSSMT